MTARLADKDAEAVRERLLCHTAEAVETLLAIMRAQDVKPETRIKAAESILDRVGGFTAGAGGETCVRFEGDLGAWSR